VKPLWKTVLTGEKRKDKFWVLIKTWHPGKFSSFFARIRFYLSVISTKRCGKIKIEIQAEGALEA
jgi:hypothetical protein